MFEKSLNNKWFGIPTNICTVHEWFHNLIVWYQDPLCIRKLTHLWILSQTSLRNFQTKIEASEPSHMVPWQHGRTGVRWHSRFAGRQKSEIKSDLLCISNSERMCNLQKSTFCIMCTRGSWRKTKKKVCWSAIGSDFQKLVDTHSFAGRNTQHTLLVTSKSSNKEHYLPKNCRENSLARASLQHEVGEYFSIVRKGSFYNFVTSFFQCRISSSVTLLFPTILIPAV